MIALLLLLSVSQPSLATALRGFDNSLSPQVLATLSGDPVAELIAVADDDTQPLFVRARAIALFGRYVEPRTQAALVRLSSHEAAELRVKAVKGLKWQVAKNGAAANDPAVRAVLSRTLNDSDRFVRMQAVRALAAAGAREPLERQRLIESDAGVRHTLDEVLR